MRRVSVVGAPGSGKSTLAARLAGRLGATHVELDAIFHQPGWTALPADEFRRRVDGVLDPDTIARVQAVADAVEALERKRG